jgi:transcriptional regulator GlxA family with amidase domain
MTLLEVFMPKLKQPVSVGIFLVTESHLGLTFLIRDLFSLANKITSTEIFAVDFFASQKNLSIQGCQLTCRSFRKMPDVLIVPPLDSDALDSLSSSVYEKDWRLLQKFHQGGGLLTSICLGSFILARSGLLNGKHATTHWAFVDRARQEFAAIDWDEKSIICDAGRIITAGGLLSGIDLALYLIAKFQGRELAHQVGKIALADTARKTQSFYAESLVKKDNSSLNDLRQWIEKHLSKPIQIEDLAKRMNMSLRSFQRHFTEDMGMSPIKYLQQRRVEKTKQLLRNSQLKIESLMLEAGFNDAASFRKVFVREVGVTPSEYRSKMQH